MASLRRLARASVPPQILYRARQASTGVRFRASPLTDTIGQGRCGEVTVRPIARADGPAWGESMGANLARMQPWWGLSVDDEHQTDALAFEHHYAQWESRRRRGTGICLGLITPDGLAGELQVWHLSPGGLTCEGGLWISPNARPLKQVVGALAFALDRLVDGLGVQRIDAPVAVANPLPRRFLEFGGFQIEARIPRWRELRGELVDYDLFALTPQRWRSARPAVEKFTGGWASAGSDSRQVGERYDELRSQTGAT